MGSQEGQNKGKQIKNGKDQTGQESRENDQGGLFETSSR